jgi:hypothetical protein
MITGATIAVNTIAVHPEDPNCLVVNVRFSNSNKDLFGSVPGKFGVNGFKNDRWIMWFVNLGVNVLVLGLTVCNRHKFETLSEARQCHDILKQAGDCDTVYVWDLTTRPNKIVVL